MNTKHKNYKRVLKIRERINELWQARRDLGYVDLEEPYQYGWNAYWSVREDVARSEIGGQIQGIINHCGKSIFSKNKDFKRWIPHQKKFEYEKPYFRKINSREYETLYPWVKKWLVYDPTLDKQTYWGVVKHYTFNIPEYMLDMTVEENWVTRYKEHDELIEQELSELEYEYDKLTQNSYFVMTDKSGKPYKKFRNREFRNKTKMSIRKAIIDNDFDNMDLPIEKKQVKWDMW